MWVTVSRRLRAGPWVAEFVRFTLDDGSEVMFECAESDLVVLPAANRALLRWSIADDRRLVW
jgi:hypothetical protein